MRGIVIDCGANLLGGNVVDVAVCIDLSHNVVIFFSELRAGVDNCLMSEFCAAPVDVVEFHFF